jgi:hypothetical protein
LKISRNQFVGIHKVVQIKGIDKTNLNQLRRRPVTKLTKRNT